MVNFCVKCRNIYHHQLNDKTKRLEYICKCCGNIDPNINEIIEISDMIGKTLDYHIDMNIIYDNTFPRTFKIKCPSSLDKDDCTGSKPVIIAQKNSKQYNVVYICEECGTLFS
jgi:hypothetical protein